MHHEKLKFDSINEKFGVDRQRLVVFCTKSKELVREYKKDTYSDFANYASRAMNFYDSMGKYIKNQYVTEHVFRNFEESITMMKSVLELVVIPKGATAKTIQVSQEISQQLASRTIFIVHGHDEENTLKLHRYLEGDLKLKAIILRYESGKGRTLIEKFEQVAQQAGYAFVLWTPDDNIRELIT